MSGMMMRWDLNVRVEYALISGLAGNHFVFLLIWLLEDTHDRGFAYLGGF